MNKTIKLHNLNFKTMIPAAEIESAVSRIAAQINQEYMGSTTPPLLVGVLNGSFMFLSDLVKKLEFGCEVTFIKIASYSGTKSSGEVSELIGLNSSIQGRDLIVVEDIVDSGNSIEHTLNMLSGRGANSIKVCTLFFKPKAYTKTIKIDYKAFDIGNEFIVGYGLDYDQLGRNFKDIYVVCDE
ncbi:MAG: hypoxanthine phosphoribosyltransferase [Rikenellaceae bacterium]